MSDITPIRNRLEAQTIGMCQVLRSWLRAGPIQDLDPFFISLEEATVDLELAQMSDQEIEDWATEWLARVTSAQEEAEFGWETAQWIHLSHYTEGSSGL
ncbi:hypothetical protein HIM_11816 [Hirsutella minnesotensis 3608]|uniref:Uncharacterized protein n=1 Tax=Hirsutella minnesotensis 3608 TaxID=1043627 RepID=A0A0F7ZWD8_9HYPO|nr:hypothetical protein HIM_11816 [Hirsutella minnesotensis 3608]